MIEITGCGTALVTPFKIDLNVDIEGFRKLVKRQINGGIHFLVPLGTTGETPCLDLSERMSVLEITVDESQNKVPVIAGAGSNNTAEAIRLISEYEKVGVDGFLIVTPYYNKPTQDGLYTHFKAIAQSTEKPIVMYNVPSRTGCNMNAETTLKLSEIQNIVGIKEASSNYIQISEIIRNASDDFSVISGNDIETLSICATGGKGVISVASNVAPKEMSSFVNMLMNEDYERSRMMHFRLTELFINLFMESNPIPAKAALSEMGYIENILRPPLYKPTKQTINAMKAIISELKIS